MNTDPIADLITRIRNASRVNHNEVHAPYARIKLAILKVMKEKGFIKDVEVIEKKSFKAGLPAGKELKITLSENSQLSLKRISKPGKRIYIGNKEIKRVVGGLGINILSTPKGVLSGDEARKLNVGGELLCEIF